ncbi:MAG: mechanosensitive ion channel family protein, partial [Thiobacillus sp.]
MFDLLENLGKSFVASSWLPQVLLVTGAVVAVNLVAYTVLHYLEKVARRSAAVWDDALIQAARRPATLALWVIGAYYAARVIHTHQDRAFPEGLTLARDTVVVAAFAWFLLRLIGNLARGMRARALEPGCKIDPTTIDALSKLGRITVVILAGLVIAQTLGFSVSGVLAFGGIGGIAVGFAA